MEKPVATLLWVDDEIENLTAHLTFLKSRGYLVDAVASGADALKLVDQRSYDLVFLDENMPGMGGLETLGELKKRKPFLPVVMITKSEAESLMEEAIGRQITDFLIKPVNPNQILMTIKKSLDNSRITHEITSRDYLQSSNRLNQDIDLASSADDWIEVFTSLTRWELAMASVQDDSIRQMLTDQKRQANLRFIRFVEDQYRGWVNAKPGERPLLSVDILQQVLVPELKSKQPVFYIVIDCLRSDQWMEFEARLTDYFTADTRYYFSILPTATPYSRNSLFSGLFPSEIENRYPDLWTYSVDSEESLNAYEAELLKAFFARNRTSLSQDPRYFKINTQADSKGLEQSFGNLIRQDLTAVVINFVDMISHARSEMGILKELAPDEQAYRSLSNSWFDHSFLKDLLINLSKAGVKVVVTSDHGCVRCTRGTRVNADRETSTNLRYKYGRNLNGDPKDILIIRNPNDFRLPKYSGNTNYMIAKQDAVLLYPNNYNQYQNQFRDTFQHGGLSMEEMIVPVSVLSPRLR
ncbi:MAG: bifunctional response regulator/alkaline phosphatase family protein [Bacteroidetes bacterium]|nr:bifunctional response regulator/alkaline phosphatase family protein [Bacteroidota bacterium]